MFHQKIVLMHSKHEPNIYNKKRHLHDVFFYIIEILLD